jgi:hypothetical protein
MDTIVAVIGVIVLGIVIGIGNYFVDIWLNKNNSDINKN